VVTSCIDNYHHAVSKFRDRDFVLRAFLPCALWILKRKGKQEAGYPGLSVQLPGDVVLCRSRIDVYRLAVSVYGPVSGRQKKVFSAHVTNRPDFFDAGFYRNCEGHVGIMSWRRGEWEDVILVQCFQNDAEGFWQIVSEAGNVTLH
jgi:hypothetical protein